MGLLSFFQRNANPAASSSNKASTELSVQQLRVRARRRLIGAAVLVGLGVIGFPLVFETQPRPIPVDLPIEIPKKDGVPPLAIPQPAPGPAASVAGLAPTVTPAMAPSPAPAIATRAEVPREAAPAPGRSDKPVEPAVAEKPAAAKTHEKAPVEKTAEKPGDKTQDKPAKPTASAAEAARVQALLDGSKPAAAAAANARFVVQVGAYADSKSAQDARMKLERMGLKTYVQAVETKDGKRIRVRVGPYASREEADKVAGKVRDSGLSTAVLSL